jgi:hypothetical protein
MKTEDILNWGFSKKRMKNPGFDERFEVGKSILFEFIDLEGD